MREEILAATTELLLETGDAGAVSIRSVAGRVGVTAPSIYLHFADKGALLDAVCARWFGRLDAEMRRAAGEQRSPLEALHAQGLAYVRFALDNPELYRIATMGRDRPGGAVDTTLDSAVLRHLRASVQALMTQGTVPAGDATAVALELWTAVHGVVALLIAKPHLPWGDPLAFADRVLRAVCIGQIVAGRIGPGTAPDATIRRVMELLR